ncbi:MAG: PspC domain-containing protein [Bacteroidales bacterium]|jgi:phage shock protein PspC (stress-responsive transcriptional regulator)|nr:PspC domain-containing protein [Bacteroidales bacterium]
MKTLRRSTTNRVIGGVCGGIAEYFELDPTLIRLAFLILAFLGGGGILIYIVAWIIVPEKRAGDNIQDAELVSEEKKPEPKKPEDQLKENLKEVEKEIKEIGEKISKEVEKKVEKMEKKGNQRSGWFGYLLIFIGVVSFLKIFGWLHFSWRGLLDLWPVLLIFLGVSMIPMKQWLRNILLTLCVIGALTLLFCNTGYFNKKQYPTYWHWNCR